MCYAYKSVYTATGEILRRSLPEIRRLIREGNIVEVDGEFHFAKDTVPVIVAGGVVRPMRWDLIPAGFMRAEKPDLAEAIRKKNSRAANPSTGKSWGFSSYNARVETVRTLWTFKDAWQAGRRAIMPVAAFRERPNMDGAPPEFRGREYEIALEEPRFLAALYDTWESRDGERLDSCTVITGPSDDVPAIRGIWHERIPMLLPEKDCEAWLDSATSLDEAYAILLKVSPPQLSVREVVKPRKSDDRPSLFDQ